MEYACSVAPAEAAPMMLGEKWQGVAWGELVFTNEKGGPLSGEFAYQHFARLLEASGVPRVRLHDLRHGAASMLASFGVPPRDVIALLGHANISTTLGIYAHSTEGVRGEAMGQLSRALWGEGQE